MITIQQRSRAWPVDSAASGGFRVSGVGGIRWSWRVDEDFADWVPDLADPGTRIDDSMARAEFTSAAVIRNTAELWALIAHTLEDARDHPGVFLATEPQVVPFDRMEFAERAAALDLATRLGEPSPV